MTATSPHLAFFDESERLTADDPLFVAGYTFRQSAYKQFSRAWRQLLATALPTGAIKAMHMTDLVQGKRAFEGIEIPDRVTCLERATKIICNHAMVVTGALVDQKEFESVAGPDWPERFRGSYTALLSTCCTDNCNMAAREEATAADCLYI